MGGYCWCTGYCKFIAFDAPDITPSVVAVAVNVYVPGVISAGAFNSIDQAPFTTVSSVPTWVAPANRVIESVPSGAVPVIVMGVVQSVTSSWAVIVGAQDIVNLPRLTLRYYTICCSRGSECVCSWSYISWGIQFN